MDQLVKNKKTYFLFLIFGVTGLLFLIAGYYFKARIFPSICQGGWMQALLRGRMGTPSQVYCMDKLSEVMLSVGVVGGIILASVVFMHFLKSKRYLPLGALILALFCFFAVIECGIRWAQSHFGGIPFWMTGRIYQDTELGWIRPIYEGDANISSEKTLLVLGDSMTEGRIIPLEKRYYARLEKALGIHVVAVASSGYGTLQEYLALKRYQKQFHPDLVLIQMHPNDFINNSWELEKESFFSNKLSKRPYWIDGDVRYLYPGNSQRYFQIRLFFTTYFRLLEFIFRRIDVLKLRFWQLGLTRGVESEIKEKGENFLPFRRSVKTTITILKMIKEISGSIPVVIYIASDEKPYFSVLQKYMDDVPVIFEPGVPDYLRRKRELGWDLYAADGVHWSEKGHQAVAEYLAPKIRELLK